MGGVFVWHTDVPYENSRTIRGPGARSAEGVPPGACFFGSFLCTNKERDAPAASGTMCPTRKSLPQGHQKQKAAADVLSTTGESKAWAPLALTPTPLPQGEGLDPRPVTGLPAARV